MAAASPPHAPVPHILDLLIRKRDGHELTTAEIGHFIRAVVLLGEARLALDRGEPPPALHASDVITESQLGAFLMALFQRGLTLRELADLTAAMRFSGETLDNSSLGAFTVDKHSTGGVGDKTSLLIAPVLAAAGLATPQPDGAPSIAVPMISGRSLGHTGGTLDKLETIPGFDSQLTPARMLAVLRVTGAALVGQTPQLIPADRILYAMRDHTGTVESPVLITASIMSKKLAEDLRGLVLDVKVGSGAFMPTYAASRHLAELMVSTGEAAGTRTVALLTSMDQPLGRFSGTWVEVWECVDLLKARRREDRHPLSADLVELSNILSGWMLFLAGHAPTPEAGAALADEFLLSGAAYDAWLSIIAAQGGDTRPFDNPAAFHQPRASTVFRAPHAGYLASMDCKAVGWAVQRLGAGRARPGDPVSAHAGLESHAKLGDFLRAGDPIFNLFSEDAALLDEPLRLLSSAITLSGQPPSPEPLVREIIQHRP